MRNLFFILAAITTIFLGSFSSLTAEADDAVTRAVTGADLIGGPFNLIDHTGKNVTEKNYLGKQMLVFFGFTSCPYICPVGLSVMSQVLRKLGERAKFVFPIFISVDPERDSGEVIAEYVKKIDERIIGLTGEPDEIKKVADFYRAYYRKIKSGDAKNYQIDHTPIIYFMDEQGRFINYFTSEQGAEFISAEIAKHLPNK